MEYKRNLNNCYIYRIKFDMVDSDTGEVISRNKQCEITTETLSSPEILKRWLESFYRGLQQGHSLSFVINAEMWQRPVQKDLF